MKILTTEEQRTLHHHFKQNDLYRQWSPILSMLQRQYNEADAQTLWHVAELQIIRLRDEQTFREQDISLIYNELLADCLKFDGATRTTEQAKCTASVVMCITLTMLMNAVEKGHEHESFDNEPMCMAIMDILSDNKFFQNLMNLFFKRDIGYDGKKVVITPSDPMQEKTIFENMDDVTKEEIKQMVSNVISRTEGLRVYFKDYWEIWESLWQDICVDSVFMVMMEKKEPRTSDWNVNQKMVCNVVGMFNDLANIKAPITTLNNALSQKNIRSYISNHKDYDGSDSVFNSEQHDRISKLIERHILSMGHN